MTLCRLVYYSQRNPETELSLPDLVRTCSRNNEPLHVTSMMHLDGDHIWQVLEGGRLELSMLYNRILADERHQNVILLSFETVQERLFADWTMGVHQGGGKAAQAAFTRYMAGPDLNPELVSVDALLDAFQELPLSAPGQVTIKVG